MQVPVPDFEGWVCGAEVEGLPGHPEPMLVFSLHAPTGNGTYQKAVNNILDRILSLAHGRELVIGGDFNLAISTSNDPANPVTKQDLAIQARLSDELGLINCWQTKHPDIPPAQTLRWNNAPTNPYHCDGIFVPAKWRDRLQSCEILSGETWNELSDHNPVVATFR